MPRYFFHVRNGIGFVADDEGRDLADEEEARAVAVDGARSLMSEEVRAGRLDLRGRIEVVDGDGQTVLVVPFGEAVEIRIGGIPEPGDPDGGAPAQGDARTPIGE